MMPATAQQIADRLSSLGMNKDEINWFFNNHATDSGVDFSGHPVASWLCGGSKPPMMARRNGSSVNVNATTSSNGILIPFTTAERADSGWSANSAGDTFTFDGNPDRVRFNFNIVVQGQGGQRTNQVVWIHKLSSGERWKCATGYIRESNEHDYATFNLSDIDPKPGNKPSYQVRSTRETTVSNPVLTLVNNCTLSFEAVL